MTKLTKQQLEDMLAKVNKEKEVAVSEQDLEEATKLYKESLEIKKAISLIDYDPIRDEYKPYSLAEFVQIVKNLADKYADGQGDTYATFDEWFESFVLWKSW